MKPGDKVIFLGPQRGGYFYETGKEYTIASTFGDFFKVDSISLEGYSEMYPPPASWFELVEQTPAQDYMELFL